MKNGLVYIAAYLAAFVLTTILIIFLNSNFNNIFKFDFRPVQTASEVTEIADSLNTEKSLDAPEGEIAKQVTGDQQSEPDNINHDEKIPPRARFQPAARDTIVKIVIRDTSYNDSLSQMKSMLQDIQKSSRELLTNIKKDKVEKAQDIEPAGIDTLYQIWVKKTARIYDSMDPRDAAKIIKNYSDNIAKDIVYKMKQKKAAQVLAALKPEIAKKITQAE